MTWSILSVLQHAYHTQKIIGATGQSLNQMIAAMVISGFGTGMSLVNYPGLAEILPNKYRAVGFAWTEANLIPMSIFGSLAGHALAERATWRWVGELLNSRLSHLLNIIANLITKIFIIGGILGVITLVGTATFYFPPSRPRAVAHIPRRTLLKEMDYIGQCILNMLGTEC